MIPCGHVERLSQLHIDGQLGPKQSAALQRHLSKCSRCAAVYEQTAQLDRLLSEYMPAVEPPAGFVDGVMAALPANPPQVLRPPVVRRRLRPAAVIAAALVLAAGVYGALQLPVGSSETALLASGGEPQPLAWQEQAAEPQPVFAQADVTPEEKTAPAPADKTKTNTNTNTSAAPVRTQPEKHTSAGSGGEASYNGKTDLPTVAYSNENVGSYSMVLLAAYNDYDAMRPHVQGHTVSYYLRVDDTLQLWQTALHDGQDPSFVETVDSMPGLGRIAGFKDESETYGYAYYSAAAPDGVSRAANCGGEAKGIYVSSAGLEGPGRLVSNLGGGQIISWGDNNKFLFTDENGLLHVYYVAENQELLLYANSVKSACWGQDGHTVVFSGYDAVTGHYNIYAASLP
ncbi:MAG: zf-HC2 domain-containing protein [Firmicutes bacterium]|nr:zf-HC2 domain-containing protein [Bacillota bacterium]